MLRHLIKWLVILLTLIAVAYGVLCIPGYGLIQLGNHSSIQAPLWLIVAALIVLVLVLWLLRRLIVGTARIPANIRQLFQTRRTRKQRKLLQQGLSAWLQQQWPVAAQAFSQLANMSFEPLLSRLMAAKAYEYAGNGEKQCDALNQTGDTQGDATTALVKTDAYLAQGHTVQAANLLSQLPDSDSKHIRQLRLAKQNHDGMAMLQALHALRKSKLISSSAEHSNHRLAYQMMLAQSRNPAQASDYWREIPKTWQQDPAVVATYCKQLYLQGSAHQPLEKQLIAALKQQWHLSLFTLLSALDRQEHSLATMEHWHNEARKSHLGLLAMGLICLHHDLPGKAEQYIQQSQEMAPSALATCLSKITKQHTQQELSLAGRFLVEQTG